MSERSFDWAALISRSLSSAGTVETAVSVIHIRPHWLSNGHTSTIQQPIHSPVHAYIHTVTVESCRTGHWLKRIQARAYCPISAGYSCSTPIQLSALSLKSNFADRCAATLCLSLTARNLLHFAVSLSLSLSAFLPDPPGLHHGPQRLVFRSQAVCLSKPVPRLSGQ
ncbi:hypothetical protein Ciccas_004805 [Cichlidogyrus casuarinus]|uniref:Uncharacterized protein n=1 Tax=Cichlidogyrus casuarinus TaxID=1844966 RepID=A0ABD2QAG3_9PLAT